MVVAAVDSILTSIKKLLGIQSDYRHFDSDIVLNINTALSILTQVGAGPSEGFSIMDDTATWGDFIGDDKKLNMVVSFVHQKVRLLFDPPQNASLVSAIKESNDELLWRIQVAADPAHSEPSGTPVDIVEVVDQVFYPDGGSSLTP